MKEFCLLRTRSISGQLDGTIPSTANGQAQDNLSLLDASDITISAMGSMGNMENRSTMKNKEFTGNRMEPNGPRSAH